YLKSPEFKKDRQFWHEELTPFPAEVQLSTKTGRRFDLKGNRRNLPVPGNLQNLMNRYEKEHGMTKYKLVFAALAIYISRATRIEDVVIGGAGHNRSTPKQKKIMGMFVSTLPIRVTPNAEIGFQKFTQKVGEKINKVIRNHQAYPFDILSEELRETQGVDPLYLLNINLIGHPALKEEDYRFQHCFPGNESAPLTLHLNIYGMAPFSQMEIDWDYQTQLFGSDEIETIHRGLMNILTDALTHPD
ncbi:MAG: hypothetical protein GY765_03680, partial [bacterium]|nr:hypothetical protein [bacterium]